MANAIIRIATQNTKPIYPANRPIIINSPDNSTAEVGIDINGNTVVNFTGGGFSPVNFTYGTVTAITAGAGLIGGTITTAGEIALDAVNQNVGQFSYPTLTVDQFGRITAAVSNSEHMGTVTAVTAGAGLIGGTITSAGTLALPEVNNTPGTYNYATITIDRYGRITSASSNIEHQGTVTAITAGVGLLGGTITGSGTISLPVVNQNVGTFNNPTLTVDGFGRITGVAANPIHAVSSITAGEGLVGGTITDFGTISLPDVNSTPGSFTLASVTVDAKGRITTVASGSAFTLPDVNANVGSFTNANITIDAKGRITAAANGSAGGSGITSITAGSNLLGGTITGSGTISLAPNIVQGDANNVFTGSVGNLVAGSGNTLGTASVVNSTVILGSANNISADQNLIIGSANAVIAPFNIIAGNNNQASSTFSTIAGNGNMVAANYCAAYGNNITINSAADTSVAVGNGITLNATGYMFGSGITSSAPNAMVVGTTITVASDAVNTAIFGSSHTINSGSADSLVAGSSHAVGGLGSAIFGANNATSANYALIAGTSNTNNSAYSLMTGSGNSIAGGCNYSIAIGSNIVIENNPNITVIGAGSTGRGMNSLVLGNGSVLDITATGSLLFGSGSLLAGAHSYLFGDNLNDNGNIGGWLLGSVGRFGSLKSSAQREEYIFLGQSTGTVVLTTDGGAASAFNIAAPADNTAAIFSIKLVALNTTTNACRVWLLNDGLIVRGTGAASVVIPGAPTFTAGTSQGVITGLTGPTVAADASHGGFAISFNRGSNTDTWNVVATLTITKVARQ